MTCISSGSVKSVTLSRLSRNSGSEMSAARLNACTEKGIDCYYIADRTVYYTAQTYLKPVTVYDDGSLRYQLRSIK